MTTARERSPISDAVAATIRAERAAAELTQSDMQDRAGIPKQTYIRIEKGQRVVDVTQLAHICAALGLTLEQFMARVGERLDSSHSA